MKGIKLYINIVLFTCLLTASSICNAQETSWSNDELKHFVEGKSYFDLELYGQSIEKLNLFLNSRSATYDLKNKLTYDFEARSLLLIAQLRLQKAEAESDLRRFVDTHHPSPLLTDAIFELADYYYNAKNYAEAIDYFEKIDLDALPQKRMSELAFKTGYCHFVRKEFDQAIQSLSFTKNVQNIYFYPVNYYYGMCEYFTGNYEGAVKSFQRVENSEVYKTHIPYYICQIYFSQKQYDQLIHYGESSIQKPQTKKKNEIRLLLGQTYFLRNDYEKALPHLEYYEANTPQLTAEQFYQLGFAQYQTQQYEKAISNFLAINLENTRMGQVANYYMADCYEKTKDLTSARAAFKKVSQLDFDKGMKEEATFNYGKLSAEMGFEREAINVLMNIEEQSPYYTESQSIINDILINTGDYENAITILESLPRLNKKLESTYQKITSKLAIQQLAEDKKDLALTNFTKSYRYPIDQNLVAQADFWTATMLNASGDFTQSIQAFDKYFVSASKADNLPVAARPYMAHYYQAYNLLKTNQYLDASDEFKAVIRGINSDFTRIDEADIVDRILPDAFLRAGDCLFKLVRYDDAVTYYDQAIERKGGDYVYALFQRGIIEGLVGQPYEKIITMESIAKHHPNSDFADDALVQAGDTYLSLGDNIQASNSFYKLLKDYKGRTHLENAANLKLGLINFNEGDIEGALAYYKNVFRNNPNPRESQEALIAIEEIYIDNLGKTDEYFNFLETIPGYQISAFAKDSLNYKIAEIQYNNANYDKAVISFNSYLTTYSKGYYRLPAHFNRGESYSLLKNYAKALPDYEYIIKEGYSDYYERSLRKAAIISYNHSQNFEKALQYYALYEELTQNLEEKYQAQLGVLRSGFRLGNNEKVITYSDKVVNNILCNKDDKASAIYYKAKTLYNIGSLDEASENFSKVVSYSSNNQAAESRYMIAKIAYEKGNMTLATDAINTSNEKSVNYPYWVAKGILLLSDIYIKNNDLLNARAAVEAVIENFGSDEGLSSEAKIKLVQITKLEQDGNRIKTENGNGNLLLDSTGN